MTKYTVKISARALEDARNIRQYLNDNASAETAQKVVSTLFDEADKLCSLPTGRPIAHGVGDGSKVFRFQMKWKYKIIFYVDEAEETVIVAKFHHSSQDPERLIENSQGW